MHGLRHESPCMRPPHRSTFQAHRLRIGRRSIAGCAYLVTSTTFQRISRLSDFHDACLVARALSAPGHWPSSRLLAWVLMPDHWHGLVQLGDGGSLSRCVARSKALATFAWNPDRRRQDRLWAHGFHDRALRDEESLVDFARYIIMNPVRAGLARTCAGYPFWDAVWLNNGSPAALHPVGAELPAIALQPAHAKAFAGGACSYDVGCFSARSRMKTGTAQA